MNRIRAGYRSIWSWSTSHWQRLQAWFDQTPRWVQFTTTALLPMVWLPMLAFAVFMVSVVGIATLGLNAGDEQNIIDILVWVLVGMASSQAIIHTATFGMIARQRNQTPVGRPLKWQMFWLANKNILMIGFHVLLAYLVTYGKYLLSMNERIALYILIIFAAFMTVIQGGRLVFRLHQQEWNIERDAAQIMHEAIQTVRDEQAFSGLASALPLVIANPTGIQYVTEPFRQLIGAQPGELSGQPIETIMPERFRERHRQGLDRYLETGKSAIIDKLVSAAILHRNGTDEIPVYLKITVAAVRGETTFIGEIFRRHDVIELEG